MVLVSPFVKICDFLLSFFFFTAGVLEPHRSRVEKKKKKTLLGHRSPANQTGFGVRYVSDIETTPKMSCWCNLD